MTLIIEICPNAPRAGFVDVPDEYLQDIADCVASGDVEPACEYVRDQIGIEVRIVARDKTGKYVNRVATDSECEATCRAIYFDSESDFSERDTADLYLIWEAAANWCET